MNLRNYEEMDKVFVGKKWSLSGLLRTAETWAMEQGKYGYDFEFVDSDGEYSFEVVEEGVDRYDLESEGKVILRSLELTRTEADVLSKELADCDELVFLDVVKEPIYKTSVRLYDDEV